MNIVFMGTPDFSVPVLQGLVKEEYTIAAVVTQPDRPKGRKKILSPPPVKEEAIRQGLKVLQPEKLKGSPELAEIISLQPDLIVTAAYGQILPKELLDTPALGAVNVHASLLPKYRGGAPIHQAVMDGEKKTGVTIMYMVPKLDAGDIITQVEVSIEEDDTTGTIHDKLSGAGAKLLLETIPVLKSGEVSPQKQNEAEATFASNITRDQEKIDWNRPARDIHNQVRGLFPWPVAYTTFENKLYKIRKTVRLDEESEGKPGEIAAVKPDSIWITAGDHQLLAVTELQPSGKKKMTVEELLRGRHPFEEGKRFTSED
ncbi:methionyl-tRNA formyltransferase [Sinobaca qinghaiensis]|uniref:Methionyl-tRNA formyltransferase n=2 Tax=Sinobaca qinghaiensis TaxID=342944 RepID=A0A419V645_9BACL|nr:methionyl-tRNA formyltransferase [Sinobaca qinghaiensis]